MSAPVVAVGIRRPFNRLPRPAGHTIPTWIPGGRQ